MEFKHIYSRTRPLTVGYPKKVLWLSVRFQPMGLIFISFIAKRVCEAMYVSTGVQRLIRRQRGCWIVIRAQRLQVLQRGICDLSDFSISKFLGKRAAVSSDLKTPTWIRNVTVPECHQIALLGVVCGWVAADLPVSGYVCIPLCFCISCFCFP